MANDHRVFGQEVQLASLTVDKVAEILRVKYPQVWQAIYTKHIDGPGQYMGYKAVAVALTSTIVDAMSSLVQNGQALRYSNGAMISGLLAKHDFPVYHVSESLFRALSHTHPPKDMKWDDLFMPYDGIVFMLPRGMMYEPKETGGAEIFMVGAVMLPTGTTVNVPGTKLKVAALDDNRIDVFWSCKPCGLTMQDCCFPGSQLLEPDATWIDDKTNARALGDVWGKDDIPDGEFSSRLSGLVANFILCMSARKELVETGQKTKKVLKSGAVIHTPSFLGRKYVVQRQAHVTRTPGAHFSDLGWRSGHYKRQWYGMKRSESKIILVDPYIAYSKGLVRDEK